MLLQISKASGLKRESNWLNKTVMTLLLMATAALYFYCQSTREQSVTVTGVETINRSRGICMHGQLIFTLQL